MKKLLFIYNAKSGKAQIKNYLSRILDVFIKYGYNIEIRPTQCKLDAKEQVMSRGNDFDLVVCSGGDGTLNEVVSGIMELDVMPLLGYIPAGSTNDFAASINLPKDMVKAARIAVSGKPVTVDIGSFNKKRFVYIAAFGAFTEVSYATSQELKNVLGHQAYLIEAVKQLANLKTYKMKFDIDGKIVEGEYLYGMVSNSMSAGGFKGITGNGVVLNDGVFEVTLVTAPKNAIELKDIITTLFGISKGCPNVLSTKASKVRALSEQKVPWVLDGEYGGSPKKIVIQNNKKAIMVMSGN